MAGSRTAALRRELDRALPDRPFRVAFWDGGELPPTDGAGPTFHVRSPRALAHVLRAPGQLGLGRAYVTGDIEVDDLDAVLPTLDRWQPPPIHPGTRLRLAAAALRAIGPTRPPRAPRTELRLRGPRHSPARDATAVRHHYDLPPEFYALFLDDSLTYSCARFAGGARTLEEAQEAKLEMVCRKLALEAGQRVLDVGCGFGSFLVHAARRHGVHAVGITLSAPQAEVARRRAREAGVGDRVEVRVADYRELRGERYDAVASIGMVEHVGGVQVDAYAAHLRGVLVPGGRLLNHGIARLPHGRPEAGPFNDRFVFPDGAPLHLSRVQLALELASLQTMHVEELRGEYAETLSHWLERFEANLGEAERLAGAERVRIWRLYLRAARNGFRTNFTTVYQVLATA